MKKLLSLSLFLSLVFFSCSTDESFEETTSQSDTKGSLKMKEDPKSWNPENKANPYDQTGKLYYKILEAYYANPTATTASEVITQIETIANTFPEFQTMQENPYSPIQLTYINTILNSELNFTNCTVLSTTAKSNLEVLIANLNSLSDNDSPPNEINLHIIDFEAVINSNTSMPAFDKKQILISTSFIRHNNYVYAQKKGRRWDIHHGIIGANEGQNESLAKASTNAAVIDALENYN